MATRKRKVEAETPTMTCAHCRYFDPSKSPTECHAEPPKFVLDLEEGESVSRFPIVEPSDWCGFFMPRLNS